MRQKTVGGLKGASPKVSKLPMRQKTKTHSPLICLLLMVTLIGWIPAAIWATYALSQYKTEKRIQEALGDRR